MAATIWEQYNCGMQDTIRAFIAIDLPQDVKDYLGQLVNSLAADVPRRAVRWVRPERLHLTLRFIGETEKNLLPRLGYALDETAAKHQPLSLNLEGFGCFPNCKRPRVLWAGVTGQIEEAGRLKEDIDRALVPLGWADENRPFRPHLTLGRVRNARQVATQHWPEAVQPLAIPVSAIHLVESNLTPNGPIYTIRHISNLQPT